MHDDHTPAVVLAISGNDPSGGAGIQADIEAIASMGCHAAPVITTLTVQDTRNAWRVEPLDPGLVIEQAEAVLADLEARAIKLGLLGSVAVARAVADLLRQHPGIPVVLDPVLIAGGGARLAEDSITDVMLRDLLPLATVVTPNSDEARALAPGVDTLDECARQLVAGGARFVLLKGAHEATDTVTNRLFDADGLVERIEWPRLQGSFHGSGCTLASALAGLLARGTAVPDAARQAQSYVHEALARAHRIGRGQPIPNRMYWAGPRP
jgi:hydroxymethylpyrimidine/phosphomethylpyrimidine kinase